MNEYADRGRRVAIYNASDLHIKWGVVDRTLLGSEGGPVYEVILDGEQYSRRLGGQDTLIFEDAPPAFCLRCTIQARVLAKRDQTPMCETIFDDTETECVKQAAGCQHEDNRFATWLCAGHGAALASTLAG